MSKEGLETLAEFKKPHMVLNCMQCGRKGRYNVARLIEKHGNKTIRDFIAMIGRTSCPKYGKPLKYGRCRIGCNDLIYMFMALPGVDGYAEKRDEER
ncbi:hypothetical protein [Sinorhizobium psoraleae]|nr:hypothetical protein [Sinorhizobium psoraleae]